MGAIVNTPPDRPALRQALKTQRTAWLATPPGQAAAAALAARLEPLLQQLEPLCLGLYWPLPGEFDAAALAPGLLSALPGVTLALPHATREPRALHYRRWDGRSVPTARDEMGIPTPIGAAADPDLVLVPCLGFTRQGLRLGYGGGFFDRWLAAHAGVTAVGLAWSVGECRFAAEPHDQPLTLILTEQEILAP